VGSAAEASGTADGRVLYTTYDRSGGAIATRTGAGTTWGSAQDGRGLPVALLRPAGRGATRYAYDLDGRPLRKVAEAEPESGGASVGWEEVTLYDATGRVVEVQHEDGTSAGSGVPGACEGKKDQTRLRPALQLSQGPRTVSSSAPPTRFGLSTAFQGSASAPLAHTSTPASVPSAKVELGLRGDSAGYAVPGALARGTGTN
jgi:hypothetical protein